MDFSPLLTLAPLAPQHSINLFILFIYYSDNMHYIINTPLITPCHTAHILGTVFLNHVRLVRCTSRERSLDQNVLDIELLIVNPAAAIFAQELL